MPTPSAAFDSALACDGRRSPALTAGVATAYAAAAAGLLALPPAWALAGAAVALPALARDLARVARPPRLCWHADGTWSTGPAAPRLAFGAGTFTSRWLVVLVLVDTDGRVQRFALARDALAADTWRRLRARLRVAGPAVAVDAAGWRAGTS